MCVFAKQKDNVLSPDLLDFAGSGRLALCKTINTQDSNRAVTLRPWPLLGLTVTPRGKTGRQGFFHHWPCLFLGARWHYIHEKKKKNAASYNVDQALLLPLDHTVWDAL